MKQITLVILLLCSICLTAQERIFDSYYNHFGNTLQLNTDSTFVHTFRFDLVYSWTSGKFTMRNDTIYLQPILVFDTIRYRDPATNQMTDSLTLSTNKISNAGFDSTYTYHNGKRERVSLADVKSQNIFPVPERLFFRRNKIFYIKDDGKLHRRKDRQTWPKRRKLGGFKKFHSWYVRDNSPRE